MAAQKQASAYENLISFQEFKKDDISYKRHVVKQNNRFVVLSDQSPHIQCCLRIYACLHEDLISDTYSMCMRMISLAKGKLSGITKKFGKFPSSRCEALELKYVLISVCRAAKRCCQFLEPIQRSAYASNNSTASISMMCLRQFRGETPFHCSIHPQSACWFYQDEVETK